MKRRLIFALAAVASMLVVAGCGSSGSSGGGGSDGDLAVTWLYTGPKDDGGFNTSQVQIMEAMGSEPGVETKGIYNVPYSQQSASIVKQAIAGGADVVVDTLGLAAIMTDVCEQSPQVYCYASADPDPQPENSVAYWIEDWQLSYMAGVAAGRTTKSNKIGLIGSYEVPLIMQSANAYQLGCQAVNPKCTTSVVWINSYFDPTKATQAAESLINSGVDVLRNWVDDPSFCQVAARRGVWAIGNFLDFSDVCPKSIVTSTVWDMSDYFKEQARIVQDGEFESTGDEPDFVTVTGKEGGPRLGAFGDFVSEDTKKELEDIQSEMADGEQFIRGPLTDKSGKERLADGETFPPAAYLSEIDWYVEGVNSGG